MGESLNSEKRIKKKKLMASFCKGGMEEEKKRIYVYLIVYTKVNSKRILDLNVKQTSRAFQRKYRQKPVLGLKA